MRNRLRIVVVVVVLALLGAGVVVVWDRVRVVGSPAAIRVGYSTLTPLHCAVGEIFRHTDILQRHGFEQVEFVPFAHGKDQHEACAQGRVDATFVCEVPAMVHLERLPGLTLAGSPGSLGDMALVVPADSAVRAMADLRGHALAVQQGASSMLAVEGWIAAEKVPESHRIRLVPLPGDGSDVVEELLAGRAAAAVLWDPWLTLHAARHDLRVVKRVPFYSVVALFERRAPVEDPARYEAALREALTWGHAHLDEVTGWVAERSGLPAPVVRAVLEKNEFLGQGREPDLAWTEAVAERLQECARFAQQSGLVDSGFDLDARRAGGER